VVLELLDFGNPAVLRENLAVQKKMVILKLESPFFYATIGKD
jgi:hypothetical protein